MHVQSTIICDWKVPFSYVHLMQSIIQTPPSQVEFDDHYEDVDLDDMLGQNTPPSILGNTIESTEEETSTTTDALLNETTTAQTSNTTSN